MKKSEISEYVTNLNLEAMKSLRQGNAFNAHRLLKQASKVLVSHPSLHNLLTITLNNYGCYYKLVKKPRLALKHLEQSISVQKSGCNEAVGLAGTYLNISALHSDMGNHHLALKFTTDAIALIKQNEIDTEKSVITLAMAYNSTGVEYQMLNINDLALENFRLALITAKKIPTAVKLIGFMENSYLEAEKRVNSGNNPIRSTKVRTHSQKSNGKVYQEAAECKKLPQVTRGQKSRNKSTPSPPIIFKQKFRFLTGDRLTPMYPRTPMTVPDENININKTLEQIQRKIDFLQTKLENFHVCAMPLKELDNQHELTETFSQKSLDNFAEYNRRVVAAKKIQQKFRAYIHK